MTKQTVLLSLVCLSFVQAFANEDYSSYDDIVRELKASEVSASVQRPKNESDFDAVRIHAGTGLVTSHLNLKTPGNLPSTANLSGFEVFMGIDLFSRDWIAEGSARSFTSESFSSTKVALREFDLKVISKNNLNKTMFWRAGIGMAARYVTFDNKPTGLESDSYTTPASIFLLGLGAQFNSNVSLGADFNYRTALISDTIDKNAIDGNIRLTGTF